jgi:hypothetical protein
MLLTPKADLSGDVEAAQLWHIYIKDRKLWIQLHYEGRFAVACLGDDL